MQTEIYYSNIYFTNNITLKLSGRYKTVEEAAKEKHEKDLGVVEITDRNGDAVDFIIRLKY